ncbi:hypothetical protein ACF0H5_003116 [Mactra antiquata]
MSKMLVLLISLLLPHSIAGIECLSCNGLVSPIDCGNVLTCGSHQQCFIENYITSGGHLRFNLGCRDTLHCSQSDGPDQSLNLEQSDDILVCTQCCNSTLCNSAGCGHPGYSTSRGPVCYNCHDQMSIDDCDTISVCGRDEVCMIDRLANDVSHEQRYHTRCELNSACEDQLNKWREVQKLYQLNDDSCHVDCCAEDLCNSKCNNSKTAATHCHSNPCVHGTCSESQNTYTCTCQYGYTGRNCDIALSLFLTSKPQTKTTQSSAIDYCSPNPCKFGFCHNDTINHTFTCICETGYFGTTCDHNACASSPCHNGGTCHVRLHEKHFPDYFICTCDTHYEGRLCETDKTTTTSTTTTTPDPCVPSPCINGSCSAVNGQYVCHCHPDYQGDTCNNRRILTSTASSTKTVATTTTAITSTTNTVTMPNYCNDVICENGGHCHYDKRHHRTFCRCTPEYTGDFCQGSRHHCLKANQTTTFDVFNGEMYFTLVSQSMVQSAAFKYCHTHCLGRLLRIDSDRKYKWVHTFLLRHQGSFKFDLWIDGQWNTQEHHWETNDHTIMTFRNDSWIATDWSARKPCVNLEHSHNQQIYLLESQRCDAHHRFICEYYL